VLAIDDKRAVGYANAEGKGDYRCFGDLKEADAVSSLEKLAEDFFRDAQRIKKETTRHWDCARQYTEKVKALNT
jgi:hypothetical protein